MCTGKYISYQCTVIMSVEHNGFYCIYYGENNAPIYNLYFNQFHFFPTNTKIVNFLSTPHINKLLLNKCYQYCN